LALNTIEVINHVKQAIDDKKGRDLVILDIKTVSLIADYFIICSGNSSIQVQAIAENIEDKLDKQGTKLIRKEGVNAGKWILLDYSDVIVHVFQEEERYFYNLERLWGDAERLTDVALS
jgi:ribosome-associated protein